MATVAASHAIDAASSPVRPQGNWNWIWSAAVAGSFVAYVVALLLLRRTSARLGAVLAISAVAQLAPVAGPLLLSTDTYTYWSYGRVAAVHHANPYTVSPAVFPNDPSYGHMGSSWRHSTSIYGPAFTVLSEAHAKAVGTSPTRAERLYRLLAGLSVLAVAVLASRLGTRAAFAAAFVGWNPLLALHFGGGGHNDALMMALVLGALLFVRRRRPGAGGALWALAVATKWVAAAFVPLVLLAEWRRHRRLGLVGLAAAAVLIAAVATALYGTAWTGAAGRLASQARQTGSLGLSKWLGELGLAHRERLAVLAVAQVGLYGWLLRSSWRGRPRLGLAGTGLAALQGWLNPWYAVWGVSLAACEDDRLAQILSIALCALVLRDALPL